MEPRIPIDREKIEKFCAKWSVKEFYLFGSVLRDDFGPDSDVDVCVRFDPNAPWDLMHIVEMIEELEGIFGRKVDLLEADAIRNPFRKKRILQTRRLIYAA
ncbi:MAG: nucleotidyltransferase family protein [Candidatus Omnitrophota bacterium]